MQQQARHDDGRSPSSQHSRSNSFSSETAHTLRPSLTISLPQLRPPPAYVALAAASQLATDNQKGRAQEELYDLSSTSPPEDDGALFSERALAMINAFLDQLLYNFISSSRSTSLNALRIAVEQVLKGKLARLAIGSADEELQELLAEGEDDELASAEDERDKGVKHNVEMVFKRTRLRIMVYTRLGEMEDEDEAAYLQEEGFLSEGNKLRRISEIPGLVSWAATIFLTSVLEYVGEQCIDVASQATYGRLALRRANASSPMMGFQDGADEERAIIEEHDVERIALNSTLGRVWRTWRKNLRTPRANGFPTSPQSRSVSARTSTSTLRPGSPLGQGRDGLVVVGVADARAVSRTAGQSNTAQRSPDENRSYAKQPKPGYLAEDDIDSRRVRATFTDDRAPSPDTPGHTSYGHPTSERLPDDSQHKHAVEETDWQERRSRNSRRRSYRNSGESGSAFGAQETPRIEGDHAVVPVSGVLHLHLPTNGSVASALGRNAIPEETVARFDYAAPSSHENSRQQQQQHHQTVAFDIPQTSQVNDANEAEHVTNGINGIHQESQTATHNLTDAGQSPWMSDVSNTYHPDSTNKNVPLRVRIPADDNWHEEHSLTLPEDAQRNGSNTSSSVYSRQGTNQPTRILKTVTARSITPSSDVPSRRSSDFIRSEALSSARPTSPQLWIRPPVANLTPSREGYLPREPRIQTESTRDLTDFIRSTAPNPDQARVAPIMTSTIASPGARDISTPTSSPLPQRASAKALDDLDGTNGPATAPTTPYRQNGNTQSDERGRIQQLRSDHSAVSPLRAKANRTALEPRDPIVRGRSNDDLIAFLRQGPPGADFPRPTPREGLERRTADRFAMVQAGNRTSELTLNPPSMSESVNSNSALLPLNSNKTESFANSSERSAGTDASTPQPPMKQRRRIKDPYAIDSDDEEEDVLTALPRKERGEESLIDFLNSTGPTASESPASRGSLEIKDSPAAGVSLRSHTLQKLRPVSPITEKGVSSPPRTPSKVLATPAFGAGTKSSTTPELGEFLSGRSTPVERRLTGDAMTAKYNNFDRAAPAPSVNRGKEVKDRTKADGRGVRGLLRKLSSSG